MEVREAKTQLVYPFEKIPIYFLNKRRRITMKRFYLLTAIVMIASMVLTACGGGIETVDCSAADTFCAAEVTDLGGVNDKSFNASGWKGIQDANKEFGIGGKVLESSNQSDYAKNIQQLLDEDIDLIVTVGFLLGVDTAKAAIANPDQKFAIVDYGFPDCWPGAEVGVQCGTDQPLNNVRGLNFQTDEAAMLAGYLAAGMTKTGKVATFGGIQLPTVTIFMKGFEAGVKYYNEQKGTSVEVLGWDSASDSGSFTGNFDSQDDGRAFAESFVQEGADIIMPVAGPVGLGSAAVCKETGACMIIGVDADWFDTANEYKDVTLTSVLKKIDVAVFDTVRDAKDGAFSGGSVVYALLDGGVDLAPYHEFDDDVPADLKKEVDALKQAIIDGTVVVNDVLGL